MWIVISHQYPIEIAVDLDKEVAWTSGQKRKYCYSYHACCRAEGPLPERVRRTCMVELRSVHSRTISWHVQKVYTLHLMISQGGLSWWYGGREGFALFSSILWASFRWKSHSIHKNSTHFIVSNRLLIHSRRTSGSLLGLSSLSIYCRGIHSFLLLLRLVYLSGRSMVKRTTDSSD